MATLKPEPNSTYSPDGREALGGVLLQDLAPAKCQIGVSPPDAASNTAANLMELAQPHPVRVLNNQRVDVGNINARLNDGGAYQDVRLRPPSPA